ncbi:MAG: holo-ACP synthase [Acidobacteriota bacterium]|nr:MAG: holo-ACP synthase [Acidobacteriota bacterium]
MVLKGLGVDVVDMERFEALLRRRGTAFLKRVFTEREIRYCRARRHSAQHFAARWAAKEAFFKALGTGRGKGVAFRDVEILRNTSGAPALRLGGKARALAERARVLQTLVSLSHTDRVAAAGVVLTASEKKPGKKVKKK